MNVDAQNSQREQLHRMTSPEPQSVATKHCIHFPPRGHEAAVANPNCLMVQETSGVGANHRKTVLFRCDHVLRHKEIKELVKSKTGGCSFCTQLSAFSPNHCDANCRKRSSFKREAQNSTKKLHSDVWPAGTANPGCEKAKHKLPAVNMERSLQFKLLQTGFERMAAKLFLLLRAVTLFLPSSSKNKGRVRPLRLSTSPHLCRSRSETRSSSRRFSAPFFLTRHAAAS